VSLSVPLLFVSANKIHDDDDDDDDDDDSMLATRVCSSLLSVSPCCQCITCLVVVVYVNWSKFSMITFYFI